MLQSRLIAKRPSFSSVDEHIAQVILTMPYDPDLTSTSLAQVCEVSQSTIVRFAQKLGYDSFRSFLSDYVAYKLAQPHVKLPSTSFGLVVRLKEGQDYIDAHAKTPHVVESLRMMCEAKRCVIIHESSNDDIAIMMMNTFHSLMKEAINVHADALTALGQLSEHDVIIVLEASDSTALLEAVLLCKHSQLSMVLVTQKVNSSLAAYMTHTVNTIAPAQHDTFAHLEFMQGCLHLMGYLIEMMQAHYSHHMEAKQSFEQRVTAIKALAQHKRFNQ